MKKTQKQRRFHRLFFGLAVLFLQCQKQNTPFPVLALEGPNYAEQKSNQFSRIKQTGFTLSYSSFSDPALNRTALDQADSAGVKLIISDRRIKSFITGRHSTFSELDAAVEDYSHHPAFYGYMLGTQIGLDDFERVGAVKRYLHNRDPVHPAFMIVWPLYATPAQLNIDDYQAYIQSFMTAVEPHMFCLDFFPESRAGSVYFNNLQICFDFLKNKETKFWGTVLSLAFGPIPPQKHSYLRFQSYCALAYGASGLAYHSFYVPRDEKWNYQEALLDSNGQQTSLLKYAAEINREIQKIGTKLQNLTPTGVYHSEPVPPNCKPLDPGLNIQKIHGQNVMAGFFKDNAGHEYALLMNKNYQTGSKPRFYFNPRVTKVIEVPKNTNDPLVIQWQPGTLQKSFPVLFKAGDGRLFRFKTKSNG